MAYEFKKLSAVEAVETPADTANVLIEEDGVIKKTPSSVFTGGGGIQVVYVGYDSNGSSARPTGEVTLNGETFQFSYAGDSDAWVLHDDAAFAKFVAACHGRAVLYYDVGPSGSHDLHETNSTYGDGITSLMLMGGYFFVAPSN